MSIADPNLHVRSSPPHGRPGVLGPARGDGAVAGTGQRLSRRAIAVAAMVILGFVWPSERASGQAVGAEPAQLPLGVRPSLFGGPGSPEDELRKKGFGVDLTAVQFAQGMVSGDGPDNGWQYGGKAVAKLAVDGAKAGLWEGFSMSLIGEYQWGRNINGQGGTLFPVNTALTFPQDGGSGGDLSLTFTQRFSKEFAITVGKFNMVDFASRTPLLGGGGIDTFWNACLASPITGLVPPYLTGASFDFSTSLAQISVMVYDPQGSTQSSGLDHWGQDGISGRMSVLFPVKIDGRSGYQSFTVVATSQDSVDLADIPYLILPPGIRPTIDTKSTSWYMGYSFQQYLYQNPENPREGWGVFGQAGFSDANPNPYRWMALAGVGGTSPIPGRNLDRFGVAYFRYSFSKDLVNSLQVFKVDLGDEYGVELFYNAAVAPWFRLSADLQYIRPGTHSFGNAFLAGVSAQIKF
jgi:porin